MQATVEEMERLLNKYRGILGPWPRATASDQIGMIICDSGEAQSALPFFDLSLKLIAQSRPCSVKRDLDLLDARVKHHRASAQFTLRRSHLDQENAFHMIQESGEIAELSHDIRRLALSKTAEAKMQHSLGNIETSAALVEEALSSKAHNNKWTNFLLYSLRARLYLEMGQREAAVEDLKTSASLLDMHNMKPEHSLFDGFDPRYVLSQLDTGAGRLKDISRTDTPQRKRRLPVERSTLSSLIQMLALGV
jgi:hypothetical protein